MTTFAIGTDTKANSTPVRKAILLVEDEELLRDMARSCLETEGYSVLDTESAHEAIALWNTWSARIQLLIVDSGVHGMRGTQLAKLLMDQEPELNVLFVTAHPNDQILSLVKARKNVHLISKPFRAQQLADEVNAVLGD